MRRPARSRTEASEWRFWRRLFPDFTVSLGGRDTTETFRLLVAAMFGFGFCLLLWSVGAAMLRVGILVSSHPQAPSPSNSVSSADGWSLALQVLWYAGLLLLQVLRATGSIAAIYVASGLVGGLLGSKFGLARPSPATVAGTSMSSRANWRTSTNLTDISDWLTKIIVGVGLVTATSIWSGLLDLTNAAAALKLFKHRTTAAASSSRPRSSPARSWGSCSPISTRS